MFLRNTLFAIVTVMLTSSVVYTAQKDLTPQQQAWRRGQLTQQQMDASRQRLAQTQQQYATFMNQQIQANRKK